MIELATKMATVVDAKNIHTYRPHLILRLTIRGSD
jgi:hypothetical protein